jgi:serine/threonine protein kinase/Tfp pilus assembly protein PilF
MDSIAADYPSSMVLSAGTRLGSYEILSPLGAGGMGEVYRARDPRLAREVAVKVLPAALAADREALARFEREARAVAALSHPNILAIFDFGDEGGVSFAVMELLEGETLRQKLAGGPLSGRKAADYALQIAEGLAAAHARGIVHRDLKPENLFLTKEDFVKILDFGLARRDAALPAREEANISTAIALTEPGMVMGTVGYMSPEQARGKPVDARSDIFSFGAVVFEMLSGERPFQRETAAETLTAILRDDPPDLPAAAREASPALDRIVRRCLEKDPEARFQLARDIAFTIEAVAGTRTARPQSAAGPAETRRSVAVLFFKDLAGNPENAHLGLGLADATITELSLVKSLLVRPTAAILRYQDRGADPEALGRELGVDAVVNGTFQRSGSRLRVTVQLIATADGRSLWGSKIDTSLDDIFQMQDEVSRRIAQALEVELSPSDERRLARAARPDGRAYEMYLKGRFHLLRETMEDAKAAIECFEKVGEADPGFALGWAGLSAACVRMGFSFDPEGEWLVRAEAAYEKALAIDAALPEGRFLKGLLLWTPRRGFDHAGAIREFLGAIAGRPNLTDAHHSLGLVFLHLGMFEEADRHMAQALAIDPENVLGVTHEAWSRYLQGKYREGFEMAESANRKNPAAWGTYQVALCQIRLGDLEGAERMAESGAHRTDRDRYILFDSVRGLIAALRGDAAAARDHVDRIVRNKKSFGHYHHAQYDIACIHALLGERDRALDWLTDAAHSGFPCHSFFERDRFLDSLRGERFDTLMGELKAETDGYRRLYRELQVSRGGDSGGGQISGRP